LSEGDVGVGQNAVIAAERVAELQITRKTDIVTVATKVDINRGAVTVGLPKNHGKMIETSVPMAATPHNRGVSAPKLRRMRLPRLVRTASSSCKEYWNADISFSVCGSIAR